MEKNIHWGNENFPWLLEGEIPADPVTNDFRTNKNKLSMFLFEADDEETINRIAAAYSAMRENVNNFDYVIFNKSILDDLAIEYSKKSENLPDEYVNNTHINLINLSAERILELTKEMLEHGRAERISKKRVKQLIGSGIRNGNIDINHINPNLLNILGVREGGWGGVRFWIHRLLRYMRFK